MVDLVRSGEIAVFVRRAHDFEAADLADVLAALDEDERITVVQALPPELSSQALAELPEDAHAEDTLAALSPERAAEIVEELEDDDAAGLLREMEPHTQELILQEVEHRAEVERLLRYDEETAGGRMTTHLVTVRETATAAEALDEIRRQSEEVEDFYQVFVVDGERHLVGHPPVQEPGGEPARAAHRRVHGRRRHLRQARSRPGRSRPADGPLQPAERRRGGRRRQAARPGDVRRRHRRGRGGDDGGPAQVRRCLGGRGAGGPMDRVGQEPASLALRQPADRVHGRQRRLVLSGHAPADRGPDGVDADHRGDGRQRGDPGARRDGAPAGPGTHPQAPVRAGRGEGGPGGDHQRPRRSASWSAASRR